MEVGAQGLTEKDVEVKLENTLLTISSTRDKKGREEEWLRDARAPLDAVEPQLRSSRGR